MSDSQTLLPVDGHARSIDGSARNDSLKQSASARMEGAVIASKFVTPSHFAAAQAALRVSPATQPCGRALVLYTPAQPLCFRIVSTAQSHVAAPGLSGRFLFF